MQSGFDVGSPLWTSTVVAADEATKMVPHAQRNTTQSVYTPQELKAREDARDAYRQQVETEWHDLNHEMNTFLACASAVIIVLVLLCIVSALANKSK